MKLAERNLKVAEKNLEFRTEDTMFINAAEYLTHKYIFNKCETTADTFTSWASTLRCIEKLYSGVL